MSKSKCAVVFGKNHGSSTDATCDSCDANEISCALELYLYRIACVHTPQPTCVRRTITARIKLKVDVFCEFIILEVLVDSLVK